MIRRSLYYVTNPTTTPTHVGAGKLIKGRAFEEPAWLSHQEAVALKEKGWAVHLKDSDAEQGIGPEEDSDISVAWDDITGKPSVIAAGSTNEEARAAIGAGTSNLEIGTTAGTAKAGDYVPDWSDIQNKPQGSSVPDATGGTEADTINALLASLRSAGFIA